LFTAPIQVHIFLAPDGHFPRPGYTPIYLTSTSIPPYIRLHLLSKLLLALEFNLEPEDGLFMTIMRILEDEWETTENNGPPDISTVLKNILPHDSNSTSDSFVVSPHPDVIPGGKREKRVIERRHYNPHENNQMKHDLEVLQASEKVPILEYTSFLLKFSFVSIQYVPILATRKRLPAFAARDQFLEHLESSRVVVVVGETGLWLIKTFLCHYY
jgi:ATP-dependent RNA helicase DHX57